jgi:hypothetical protein
MTADTRTAVAERGRITALVLGFFLAPFAAMLHLQLSYMDVRHACRHASELRLNVESAILLVVALTGVLIAWRGWQGVGASWPSDEGGKDGRSRFLFATGMLLSALFALVIFAQWIPIWTLSPCQ